MPDNPVQRLFFAVWPDPQTATRLTQASSALVKNAGRRLATPQLHLTLAFLGTADAERQACYCRIADTIQGHAFTMQLDRCGHFPRPQVVWLGVSMIPAALAELQQGLVGALAQHCEYVPEKRPFAPHITVWRKVRKFSETATIAPVAWPVSEFVLAASRTLETGAEYSVLRRWPLVAD